MLPSMLPTIAHYCPFGMDKVELRIDPSQPNKACSILCVSDIEMKTHLGGLVAKMPQSFSTARYLVLRRRGFEGLIEKVIRLA
jgi:hypothetical protein